MPQNQASVERKQDSWKTDGKADVTHGSDIENDVDLENHGSTIEILRSEHVKGLVVITTGNEPSDATNITNLPLELEGGLSKTVNPNDSNNPNGIVVLFTQEEIIGPP